MLDPKLYGPQTLVCSLHEILVAGEFFLELLQEGLISSL